MAKALKKYIITGHLGCYQSKAYKSRPLTIDEAVDYYGYTLEKGASWQHEKGNKKINRHPTTLKSLLSNLTNAVNNAAANGYGGYYTAEEAVDTVAV
jgi:hypothetical protein